MYLIIISSYGLGVKLAVILMMTLGAMSFSIHYQFLSYRKLGAFWSDNQHQALWVLLLGGTDLSFIPKEDPQLC